jgi:hypothetical protein
MPLNRDGLVGHMKVITTTIIFLEHWPWDFSPYDDNNMYAMSFLGEFSQSRCTEQFKVKRAWTNGHDVHGASSLVIVLERIIVLLAIIFMDDIIMVLRHRLTSRRWRRHSTTSCCGADLVRISGNMMIFSFYYFQFVNPTFTPGGSWGYQLSHVD